MTRTKLEINVNTGEVIERPYTDEENAQADIDEASERSDQP
jgi:hypothetical protein